MRSTKMTNDWWGEYRDDGGIKRPFTPGRKPIQSATKPAGSFAGPFCCEACAHDCVNFGATKERARAAIHGTADESFCAWLGGG